MLKLLVDQFERNRDSFNEFIRNAPLDYLRNLSGEEVIQLAFDKLYSPGIAWEYAVKSLTIEDIDEDWLPATVVTNSGQVLTTGIVFGTCSWCDAIEHLNQSYDLYTRSVAKTLILSIFQDISLQDCTSDTECPELDIEDGANILGNPDTQPLTAVNPEDAESLGIEGIIVLEALGEMLVSGVYKPGRFIKASHMQEDSDLILVGELLEGALSNSTSLVVKGYGILKDYIFRGSNKIIARVKASILKLLPKGEELLYRPKSEDEILGIRICKTGSIQLFINKDIPYRLSITSVDFVEATYGSVLVITGNTTKEFSKTLSDVMGIRFVGAKVFFVSPAYVSLDPKYSNATIHRIEIFNTSGKDQLKVRIVTNNFLNKLINVKLED